MLFKARLKLHFLPEMKPSQPWHFHSLFQGKIGRFLMQIALGLSPLKSHLFKYNITDNPFCQLCKQDIETPVRYFCTCPALCTLSNQRRVNVNDEVRKRPLFANVVGDININDNYLRLLLNGISFNNSINTNISFDEFVNFHVILYRIVSTYVFSTKRLVSIGDVQWFVYVRFTVC